MNCSFHFSYSTAMLIRMASFFTKFTKTTVVLYLFGVWIYNNDNFVGIAQRDRTKLTFDIES